jgi:DNA (cytosine-5)-methyltransferase 1
LRVVIDIFCGAGGLSEGFKQASGDGGEDRFQVAYGVDKNRDAVLTFRRNILQGLPADAQERRGAVRSVVGLTGTEILSSAGVDEVDILIGGPNCQAVSTAGSRNTQDERNDMFGEFVRLIEELRPRWFVMENVPGLTHSPGLPILHDVFTRLSSIPGYSVAGDVLLAADYGVSQYRYRLIVIGTRTGLPIRFPKPSRGAAGFERHATVADAIAGAGEDQAQPPPPLNGSADVNIRRISHVPPGGDWRDIPLELLPLRYFSIRTSDQKGAYGRLAWDRPAYTVTGLASNVTAGRFTHPAAHRGITPAEAAHLQGFPKDFTFCGPAASQFRQIGNAVPPPLAKAIAETIDATERGSDVGIAGRLTLDVVRGAVDGTTSLPVMTPRIAVKVRKRPRVRARAAGKAAEPEIANIPDRGRLKAEAGLPSSMWTAKRARAILARLDGSAEQEIAKELKVSEASVTRWIADYDARGADGWRAYHTPVARLVDDSELERQLDGAIALARAATTKHASANGTGDELDRLLARFGQTSVNGLFERLGDAGFPVGTMYVGDLLAVADVLLESPPSAPAVQP